MISLKCPLCNRRLFGSKKDRLKKVLSGISSEIEIVKTKEEYLDYGKILNETVAWSLFQEKSRKYSAPVDMRERVKAVAEVNYPHINLDEETISLLCTHVNDVLRLIQRFPDNSIAEGYNMQRIYFEDKKYWDRKKGSFAEGKYNYKENSQ